MPGLWKEAHAVLSERQQKQEREQATGRDSEGRRECFSFFLLNHLSGAERAKERERERTGGGGAGKDANCLLGATTGVPTKGGLWRILGARERHRAAVGGKKKWRGGRRKREECGAGGCTRRPTCSLSSYGNPF